MGYYGLGPGDSSRLADPLTPLEKALRAMPIDVAMASIEIIEKLCRNACSQPGEEKFRRIKLSNERIRAAIAEVPGAKEALIEMGWEEEREGPDGQVDALVLPAGRRITMHEHIAKILDAKQHYKKEAERAKKFGSVHMQTLAGQSVAGA